jgi:hypothetical protein
MCGSHIPSYPFYLGLMERLTVLSSVGRLLGKSRQQAFRVLDGTTALSGK